jgi:hypothetical protein
MRKLLAALLLLAAPALAVEPDQLDPDALEYIGQMTVPENPADDKPQRWSYGLHAGLTMIPDCLGMEDPTPADGYPGCIGAWGHKEGDLFGMFDAVPPGQQATNRFTPFVDLFGDLPTQYMHQAEKQVDSYALYYDKGPNHCRLWWVFYDWYQPQAYDDPFLGYSSCDLANPDPQGMWEFSSDDPADDQIQGGLNNDVAVGFQEGRRLSWRFRGCERCDSSVGPATGHHARRPGADHRRGARAVLSVGRWK